ncbi:MAG TPA: Ig-like domain-containing protein, partial [Candidatus Dormibacteraeota bacterium]|nr:Ig-like domain-containing protein [Candidatus Dormibacteraeota bacterium]
FPDDTHFNYGAVVSGFITPLVTTNYVFYLRAGSQAQLLLSTDDTTNNLAQIAADSQSGPQVFLGPESINPGTAAQCSTPQFLVAGSNYAVQAFLKSSTGPNFLQVAWRMNNDSFTNELPVNDANLADRLQPIPAAVLSTVAPSNFTVTISAPPANASVPAGSKATFSVSASSSGSPMLVQWQRNGTSIPGATGTTYTTGFLNPSDNAAQIRALVSVPGANSKVSAAATLTVGVDNVKPTLLSVTPEDTMHSVVVQFSEPVEPLSALNPLNYSIPGLTVSAASYAVDTNLVDAPAYDAVRLSTSSQTDNTSYTLTVSNVRDAAASPNTILPGSSATFQSLALSPSFAKVEYFENQQPNPSVLFDLGNVNWLEANSLKFLNDDADTIVFPRSVAFSPQGNNGFRTSGGSFFGYPPLFGTRLRTYVTPTNSGPFVFYVSADDSATLWLSTDDDPANKHLIAQQDAADAFQGDWTSNVANAPNSSSATFDTNNVSTIPGATPWPVTDDSGHAVINLVAGHRYYLEANHRESSGNSSHCAVNWDNGTGITPADGSAELSGNAIGWLFPGARITGIAKSGNNVSVSWNALSGLNKGFLGYPGLLAGTITSSYPTNALQAASVVSGPYTTLTNSNPAILPATNSATFFRVVQ